MHAATAVGELHQAILGIEQRSSEASELSVLEVMHDKTLQLLCNRVRVRRRSRLTYLTSLEPEAELCREGGLPAWVYQQQQPKGLGLCSRVVDNAAYVSMATAKVCPKVS